MSLFIHVDAFKLFGLMVAHSLGLIQNEKHKNWKFKYHRSKDGRLHTFHGTMGEWKQFKQSAWYKITKRT